MTCTILRFDVLIYVLHQGVWNWLTNMNIMDAPLEDYDPRDEALNGMVLNVGAVAFALDIQDVIN